MSVSAFPYGTVALAKKANTITLHGTSGSPVSCSDTDGTAAVTFWVFYGDNANQSGTSYEGRMANKNGDTVTNYDVGNGWTSEQDAVSNSYWIRWTAHSGDTGNVTFSSGPSGYGVWHQLTNSGDTGSNAQFTLTAAGKGAFTYDATVKVDISETSGGAIIATGYYRCIAILT